MNENTSLSEEAKVGPADEATDVSSGQKDRVKRGERLCKIWELHSDNSDVYSDFCWVRYRWIVQLIEIHCNIIHAHLLCRAFFCLFSSPSYSSVRILFRLPHFAKPALRNTQLQKNYLSALSALRNARFFWRFTRSKFHRELMVVNFPSADWLSDLRTQLKAFVGGVCLQSKIFFLALFSRINFFAWSRHFKELQLKRNLFVCPQIWTVARLTYKKQKRVCELFISKYFFSESNVCTITSHFLNPLLKMFCNFLLQLNVAKRRHTFLALFVLKPRKK